jgi:hypothetical protein
MLKEAVVARFEVLSQQVSEGPTETDKTHI